jgi:excinuclease ABC subunit C
MNIKDRLKDIPKKPGCYLWKDSKSRIIYVGKAKNLFNRMKQYFNKANDFKTQSLVRDIADFEYIIVDNEKESLILEFNLIKKHRPKYNILLKDGSSYPYIQLTNEEHPKIVYVRKLVKSKGKYYGPFPDGSHAYHLVNLLNQILPFRKCKILPKQKCIYYDLGQCLAPCIKMVSKFEYEVLRRKMDKILSGEYPELIEELKRKELEAADKLEFENANKYKNLIISLQKIATPQLADLLSSKNADYIGYYQRHNQLSLAIFSYIQGKLISKHESILEIQNDAEEELSSYLLQYYEINNIPSEIYVSLEREELDNLSNILNSKFSNPEKGDNKKIMQMAISNSKDSLEKKITKYNMEEERTTKAIQNLSEILNLENCDHIEAFDNSNIQGSYAVSAMVVFKNGIKSPKDYRKFKIKTIEGSNDVGSMKEVIYRRYLSLIKNNEPRPDLIIVDGSKNQMNAAKEVLESLYLDIRVIGLKKDDRHKTNSIINTDESEIALDKRSGLFFLLSNIQEEVHRYAINYYKSLHSKSIVKSVLDNIKGLGKSRQKKLLDHFESVDGIKKASDNELAQFIPEAVIKEIRKKL